MQLRSSFLIFVTLVVTCLGEDVVSKPPVVAAAPVPESSAPPPASKVAWVGFSVRKPDPAGAAQIPSLPPGMGFVIQAVAPGGPAELAKITPTDILWKFDDQMLVNQGQLATLLGLKRPGDAVTLAIFRDGKPLETTLKLGEVPPDKREFSRDMIDAALLSDEGSPMKIVNILDRTATFSNNDGKAWIRHEGEGYQVVINGPDRKVIFDGTLAADGNVDGIPADWRRRICVLRRSLDHALESRMVPVRAPRPRVVLPPPPTSGVSPPPAEPSKH
ncbi:MAG: PDZ domain-containing protein [Verrucomicrobiota bacterium]